MDRISEKPGLLLYSVFVQWRLIKMGRTAQVLLCEHEEHLDALWKKPTLECGCPPQAISPMETSYALILMFALKIDFINPTHPTLPVLYIHKLETFSSEANNNAT